MPTPITQGYLKEILDYNPDTGIFKWKIQVSNRVKIGSIAGSSAEYRTHHIKINSRHYENSKLAWLYVYGEFPKNLLNYIDGDKHNTSILNLREATKSDVQFYRKVRQSNNTTGYKGVTYNSRYKKYYASIRVKGKSIYLGQCDDALSAHLLYKQGSLKYAMEFSKS